MLFLITDELDEKHALIEVLNALFPTYRIKFFSLLTNNLSEQCTPVKTSNGVLLSHSIIELDSNHSECHQEILFHLSNSSCPVN